jgi:hemolysin activation/secretion protein
VLGQISATAAVDGGWLERPARSLRLRHAVGRVGGLGSAGRWFASQISVGTPLHYPDWLAPDHVSLTGALLSRFKDQDDED